MSLPTISPEKAIALLAQGAVLVDVREADEHARERVPGARHIPLSKLDEIDLAAHAGGQVIFHCRSGARTAAHASRLADKLGNSCEGYVLEGGLDALKRAGHPTAQDKSQPIELMRQVQIVAGGLVFVGTVLGLTLSPWFFAIPAFVGAGLTFAGATGFCGMALLLTRAPWNRAAFQSR